MRFLEKSRNLTTAKQSTNWGKKRKKGKKILKYLMFAHLFFANHTTMNRALASILA